MFIIGYFKIDFLSYDLDTPNFHCISIFLLNNFLSCIIHFIRVSNNSITIIDNIFTNLDDAKITSRIILTYISAYSFQFLLLENTQISYKYVELLNYDYSTFKER